MKNNLKRWIVFITQNVDYFNLIFVKLNLNQIVGNQYYLRTNLIIKLSVLIIDDSDNSSQKTNISPKM